MSKGLHENSLDGFYYVSRALLVHSERHLDLFDQAFLKHFKGIEVESKKLTDDLLEWLKKAKDQIGELTEEQRKFVEGLDLEQLEKLFNERLQEQKERHDGGNKWIGTAGTSPFGHSGKSPQGIRVGGPGGGRRRPMRRPGFLSLARHVPAQEVHGRLVPGPPRIEEDPPVEVIRPRTLVVGVAP